MSRPLYALKLKFQEVKVECLKLRVEKKSMKEQIRQLEEINRNLETEKRTMQVDMHDLTKELLSFKDKEHKAKEINCELKVRYKKVKAENTDLKKVARNKRLCLYAKLSAHSADIEPSRTESPFDLIQTRALAVKDSLKRFSNTLSRRLSRGRVSPTLIPTPGPSVTV